MGIEIQVNTLEEMCDLMCDNRIPQRGEKKMSRLIDADEVLKKREILHDENGTGYQAVRTFYIRNMPTVQAVPIEVLQKIRQEIDKWHHLTDKAFNDGIDTALEIIDKHIKVIEG